MTEAPREISCLVEAGWIVPVEPHGVVLEDHALAIEGDRIVEILPAAQALARYAPREHVRLRIEQDANTYVELLIARKPEMSGP